MSITNTIDLVIDEKARNYAKIYSSLIEDEFQRKRSYASITALYAFSNLLLETKYTVQKAMTIFRNPELNQKYEISDIYINDWHIDVRVVTDSDSFIIPRIHEEFSIEPDFYAVIKIDSSLKSAQLLGFANPKTITKEPLDYHYYNVSNNQLISFEQFANIIKEPKELNLKEEDHQFFLDNYLRLTDNEIDEVASKRIMQHLFQCPKCRAEFCCFTGFEMVNCNIGKYPEILDDQTLNIIGAQAAESPKYKDKEEVIFFDDSQSNEKEKNTKQDDSKEQNDVTLSEENLQNNDKDEDIQESDVEDIIDELFNDEEDITESNQNTDTTEEILEDNDIVPDEEEIIDYDIEGNNLSNVTEEKPLELLDDDKEDEKANALELDELQIEENDEISLLEIDDSENDLNIIEENNEEPQDQPTDKVIVDYDETGEPIYSYITNISNDKDNDDGIEIIDDIESTLPVMDITDNLESIETEHIVSKSHGTNNNLSPTEPKAENEPEEINEIEEIEDIEEAPEEIEEIEEIDETATIEDSIEEVNNDEISSDEQEETLYDKNVTGTIPQEKIYETNENNDDNESSDFDNSEAEYDNQDYDSENEEDDEEYSEEDYEEDDEDNDFENDSDVLSETNKSSKKGIIIAGVITLAVVAFALTTFGLIKKARNDNAQTIAEKQEVAVPSQEATSGMFANVDDQDIFEELGDKPEGQNEEAAQNQDIATTAEEKVDDATANAVEPKNISIANANQENKGLTESDLITKQPNNDLNKVMADAFSDQSQFITSVKGINWMCLPSLFNNQDFKSYLQKIDKALKLNLNSNLLNSSSSPVNDSITYKIAIDNEGNLLKIQAASSTGSDELDSIVLQSIKETLALQKSQIISDSKQKADKYLLQVVIKL